MLLGAIDRSNKQAMPSERALSTAMHSSNLAVALRELNAQWVIERMPDQADKRKIRVALTAEGQWLLYESRARRERWLSEAISACLTAEERALLFTAGEMLERVAVYEGGAPPLPVMTVEAVLDYCPLSSRIVPPFTTSPHLGTERIDHEHRIYRPRLYRRHHAPKRENRAFGRACRRTRRDR
ncbi:hypothetical protein [Duganella violaceipulchra]|uniref:hypothetical protein n=1 Tax=Duganella violaceipulchra TaxID=2849652 RepID=UPI001E4F4F0E|nr:hypothetical protein [Duganella violaceicalia]